jgi:hypothetical protein
VIRLGRLTRMRVRPYAELQFVALSARTTTRWSSGLQGRGVLRAHLHVHGIAGHSEASKNNTIRERYRSRRDLPRTGRTLSNWRIWTSAFAGCRTPSVPAPTGGRHSTPTGWSVATRRYKSHLRHWTHRIPDIASQVATELRSLHHSGWGGA